MYLSIDAAGMITSWINGVSWRDLCKETSLDQGDICRMLRRTLEVLRQIPNAFNVRPEIVALAFEAAERMDRFPVADFDSGKTDGNSTTITAGVGFDTPRDFSKDINELMKEDSDEDVDYSAMNIDELLREDQDNGEDDDEDLLSVFEDESDIADVKGSKSDDELTKINVIRQEKIESIISEMESEIEGNKRNDKEHTQTVDRNDGDSDRDNSPGDLDIDSLLEWNDQILE